MNRFGWVVLCVFVLLTIAAVSLLGGSGPAIRGFARSPEPAPIAVAAPSGLIVPVGGVRPDQLTDSWGDARGGGTRMHQALDIMAPRGTPVLAAKAGRIEKLWTSEAGGLTAYVRGDDGFVYYYAHLDRYRPGLAEGQRVAAGEPIASVGDSGNAGAGNTHLHFGVSAMRRGERWWEGTPVNPYPLLAGDGAAR